MEYKKVISKYPAEQVCQALKGLGIASTTNHDDNAWLLALALAKKGTMPFYTPGIQTVAISDNGVYVAADRNLTRLDTQEFISTASIPLSADTIDACVLSDGTLLTVDNNLSMTIYDPNRLLVENERKQALESFRSMAAFPANAGGLVLAVLGTETLQTLDFTLHSASTYTFPDLVKNVQGMGVVYSRVRQRQQAQTSAEASLCIGIKHDGKFEMFDSKCAPLYQEQSGLGPICTAPNGIIVMSYVLQSKQFAVHLYTALGKEQTVHLSPPTIIVNGRPSPQMPHACAFINIDRKPFLVVLYKGTLVMYYLVDPQKQYRSTVNENYNKMRVSGHHAIVWGKDSLELFNLNDLVAFDISFKPERSTIPQVRHLPPELTGYIKQFL
jgi:hypothetical protein